MTDLLAVVLVLTPAELGEAPASLARAAHAWLLNRIAEVDPDLAGTLHASDQPRPFTVSNLWGAGRAVEGRRALAPGDPCWLRFTTLTVAASAALEQALPPIGETLDLAGLQLRVEQVATDPDAHPWAGRAAYADLVQQHTLGPGASPRGLTLNLASPTVFRRQGRDLPLPEPELVFGGYLRRWNEFAPVALPEEAQRYAAECVALGRFRIRSHLVSFEAGDKGAHVGFTGRISFRFLVGDAYWTRLMRLLAGYAFWCGTGYRTTAGLGQTQRLAGS
ncbi:MAG: CRISPR system precrRNA processing endoribonuclease RAMP protein Cas6 [Anaerolineales bacterium]|nr:CRISPR system precrRNA processing endoribonuclease RAMP protein Cas6 [Anaerolineales bacterium]